MADPKDDPVGVEFAAAISRFVNGNKSATATAVRKMVREHRTIQQGMMKFFLVFVEEMAKKEGASDIDPRNEAAVACAKRIMEIDLQDRVMPYV
jgi:hypothetical protein